MSVDDVNRVLQRAQDEEEYRTALRDNPDGALHGFDISYAERQALIAGDVQELRRMGVPESLAEVAPSFNEGDERQHLPT